MYLFFAITNSTNAVDLKTGSTIPSKFTTDSGDAIADAGTLNVLGGNNIATSGTGDTETISLSGTTDHAVQVGNATGSLTSLGVAIDGQLVIGSSTADPVLGSLTSTGSTVAITTGAGTINLESGSTTATSVPTDSGTATPSAGALTLAGGTNINTAGAGSTATTNLDDDIELTSVKATTFDTNIATAKVTVSGTSIVSSGTDADISIPITPKGIGAVELPKVDIGAGEIDGTVIGANSASTGTFTTAKATTFDTNVASAGVTMAGTTISADGTDANIDITMTPKGSGTVNPSALSVNSAYTFPTADGTADQVMKTSGAGVVTWQDDSAGLTWTLTTANASIVAGNRYIANKAGLLSMTLPATSTVGDSFGITNINTAVGFRIVQGANQYVRLGSSVSTVGAGGYIEATALGDGGTLICTETDKGWIFVPAPQGNLTIV